MKPSFWSGFLNAALNGALQGGASASSNGAGVKDTGITAGVGGIAGILQFLLQHPTTASPHATVGANAAQSNPAPIPGDHI